MGCISGVRRSVLATFRAHRQCVITSAFSQNESLTTAKRVTCALFWSSQVIKQEQCCALIRLLSPRWIAERSRQRAANWELFEMLTQAVPGALSLAQSGVQSKHQIFSPVTDLLRRIQGCLTTHKTETFSLALRGYWAHVQVYKMPRATWYSGSFHPRSK